MKRLGSIALSLAMLVGLTGVLGAQDSNVSAEDGNTSVSIDGSVETTVFRRDNNINTILNGGRTDAQSGMLYHYNLGLTADVGDRVTGRIELENELLDGSRSGAAANDSALIGEGTSFESTQISEASIEADRFLVENLSLKIGIQDYETDLRGDGNPFFLDLQGSESIQPNSPARDLNNDAGGALLTAGLGENHALDLFWFTVRENNSDLDGVGEDNDEHILGGVLRGSFQDQGSYQLLGTWFQDVSGTGTGSTTTTVGTTPGIPGFRGPQPVTTTTTTTGTNSSAHGIWTFGGGVEYDATSAANVYGEAYLQGGERAPGVDHDVTFAGDLGVAGEAGPGFYDFSLTHVSGDDSDSDTSDFVSYEDNDDTMILEENVLGLDVDNNYQKVQASGGVDTTVVRKDDLTFELLAAWARLDEEGGVTDDSLGIETDLKVTWAHSETLDFQVGLARVWSGDFWEKDTAATSDGLDLYTVSANLNF